MGDSEDINVSEFAQEVKEVLEAITGKSREEALAEAIETLGSEEKILLFSEVDKKEVPYLALKLVIAQRYNLTWLKDIVHNELKLRVSIKRKGRNELVKVIAGIKKVLDERVKGIFRRRGESEE